MFFKDQPAGVQAVSNGVDAIWIDPSLSQVERRCVITHELIHIEMGHTRGCTGAEEQQVRVETARRLVPIDQLLDTLRWSDSWEECADGLWVTLDVFRDRIYHLSEIERAMLVALSEEVERGA